MEHGPRDKTKDIGPKNMFLIIFYFHKTQIKIMFLINSSLKEEVSLSGCCGEMHIKECLRLHC